MTTANTVRIGILGASGYTGAELLRLLALHPGVEIRLLTADRQAGKPLGEIFPHLGGLGLPDLVKIDEADWSAVDLVFCCLPHGTTQEVIAKLPSHLKVVDLSADFRLADTTTYAEWYGHAHRAPELQKEAVYGLTELARAAVIKARLVANPGCYPTSAQLPLIPLIEAGEIDSDDIIIDAKSGVSGAGRDAKQQEPLMPRWPREQSMPMASPNIATRRRSSRGSRAPPAGPSSSISRPHRDAHEPGHSLPASMSGFKPMAPRLAMPCSGDPGAQRYAGEPFVRVLANGPVAGDRAMSAAPNNCASSAVYADRLPGRAILRLGHRQSGEGAPPARRCRT